MSNHLFKGIISYPITPFNAEDGGVDIKTLGRLIDRLIEDGSHAIAPLGSTGESAYLNVDEWYEVAEASVAQVAKRVPVVVGISDLTTQNAVRRAKFAETVGADAVMVLPISYWKLSEREIFRHYAAICEAISIPVMVYNNPATSGIDMTPELIVRMVKEIDNVTMVKESSGDIQRMHRLFHLSNGEIPFYNGSNPLALEAFAAGATGWCTAAPNLIPEWTLRLYEASEAGDLKQAREVFYKQLPLLQFILKGGLPTTIKAGLKLQGFEAGAPRKPLLPLDSAGQNELAAMLKQLHD
ncbi:putative dihydrodipicolinate synthetase [Candidatus Methylobacter favarea]|uniref:Putative dihydrodipicolinate synthetase n=1 Tax=Candidatus Methylobacter favarea TaxID=2707345 RepID=A0A8S0X6J6_9GAMM|nr:dihydrodipicolinate synthase family protein [Candidatus Methylobacter favarea]CAA9889305.1 putative dihydrodipicolinate synthetase [Candidatus Methylobacter favarea]